VVDGTIEDRNGASVPVGEGVSKEVTITMRTIGGADGAVHLEIPIGGEHAGEEVELTVQTPANISAAPDAPSHSENPSELPADSR
jgi:hypothetical protein